MSRRENARFSIEIEGLAGGFHWAPSGWGPHPKRLVLLLVPIAAPAAWPSRCWSSGRAFRRSSTGDQACEPQETRSPYARICFGSTANRSSLLLPIGSLNKYCHPEPESLGREPIHAPPRLCLPLAKAGLAVAQNQACRRVGAVLWRKLRYEDPSCPQGKS